MKIKVGVLLLITALIWTGAAFAQNIDAEWTRWDSTLTFQAESDLVEVSEVQEFNIFQGPVRFGVRAWQDPVDILNVFIVAPGQRPVQLTQGSSDAPGTYTLQQTANEIVLQFNLPQPAQSGDSFVVQMNYVTEANAQGLLDWHIVPADHGFPIQSSTAVLNFVDMPPPDAGLVRVIEGDVAVSASDNQIVLQSQRALGPDEAFQIQVPFGAGVGAAGGSNQPAQPVATVPSGGVSTVPSQPQDDSSGLFGLDLSTVFLVICGIGLLVLFGGGSLLRSLLGGFLGGGGFSPRSGGTGFFPRSGGSSGSGVRPVDPSSGSSSSRGFRPSTRSRSLPTVRSKKGSGGRAGLG